MKERLLYIICAIVIAAPWLFLLEILPVPYNQINTTAEVIIESAMFAALLAAFILLRKELKRLKTAHAEIKKTDQENGRRTGRGFTASRVIGRILFVLAALTLFIVGLILVLIAISFAL